MIARQPVTISSRFIAVAGKIAAGVIPNEFPASAGGAWGAGRPCAVCDKVVRSDQAEVEARFRDRTLPFHAPCFVQWWDIAVANGAARARPTATA